MVVFLVAKVFDQRILQHVEEIVSRGAAVVLQRVEPPRRDVGVPRQRHTAARNDLRGGVCTSHERGRKRSGRDRRPQHGSPTQCRLLHGFLHYAAEEPGQWRDDSVANLPGHGAPAAPLPPSSQTLSCESLAPNVSQPCIFVLAILRIGNDGRARPFHQNLGRSDIERYLWYCSVNGGSWLPRDRRPNRVCCHRWPAALEQRFGSCGHGYPKSHRVGH